VTTNKTPITVDQMEDFKARITVTMEANQRLMQQAAASGLLLDKATVDDVRLNLLLDTMLGPMDGPNATVERWEYELECHRILGEEYLQPAVDNINRAVLTQGVAGIDPSALKVVK
jgi:hypothetical protein